MSERRVSVSLLLAALVASSFAAPSVTHQLVTGGGNGTGTGSLPVDRSDPHPVPGMSNGEASPPSDADPAPVRDAATGERARLSRGLASIDADEVHHRGITGEGVRVGVIGSGFDRSHDAIAGNVAARRAIGAASADGDGRHGTAVAEIVARTAPDSALYLADVGKGPTAGQYADAIDWLVENDVDVVVDAGSYFPVANGRTSRITAAAERASERGVVFVTSAGNYANRHWTGESDGDGWVAFPGGSQGNGLADGNVTSGRVTLRLTWDGDADYDIYLYRLSNGEKRVVAKSVRRQAENGSLPPSESLDVAVPKGRYYVSAYAHEDDGNETRVRLFSARQTLQYATEEGSVVAPATSEHVISVGAYDSGTGTLQPYSSRGDDPGDVDIEAPDGYKTAVLGDFQGTSAAAPYVAGTAALMESSGRDLSPTETERILERTAVVDGEIRRLDTVAAVRAASETSLTADVGDPASEGSGDDDSTADGGTAEYAPRNSTAAVADGSRRAGP